MQLNSFFIESILQTTYFDKKKHFFQNPHNKTVLLMHTTLVSDQGLRFGKLQTCIDDFYSNFTAQSNIAGKRRIIIFHFLLEGHKLSNDIGAEESVSNWDLRCWVFVKNSPLIQTFPKGFQDQGYLKISHFCSTVYIVRFQDWCI